MNFISFAVAQYKASFLGITTHLGKSNSTSSTDDIIISSQSMFTFVSGRTSSNDTSRVQLSVTDDGVYEESQQVAVNIVSVKPSSAAVIGDPHGTNLTLEDNNGLNPHSAIILKHRDLFLFLPDAQVRFVTDEYRIGEESGSVSVCVESGVTGGFQTALTVGLAAQDGTASKLI